MEKKKTGVLSKIITVVSLVLCVVFASMLICNIVIIIKGALDPENPPSVLGITPMVVLSGSMSGNAPDHIEVGDLIFVGKADIPNLKVGDVITFKELGSKSFTTHRIIEVEKGPDGQPMFWTQGDANNTPDKDAVNVDRVVGIYKFRIPKIGDFALFLQTPLGMIIFISVPLLGFIVYDIIRRRMQAKKENQKNADLESELARLRALAGESASGATAEPAVTWETELLSETEAPTEPIPSAEPVSEETAFFSSLEE